MNKMNIGNRVRRIREAQGLSRDQYAEKVKISPQFLAEIENGTKGMSAETLYKLCINGKASADYILLGRQPDSDIKTPGMELLCKIPPQYSQIVEDMLRALFNAIKLAETKMEE